MGRGASPGAARGLGTGPGGRRALRSRVWGSAGYMAGGQSQRPPPPPPGEALVLMELERPLLSTCEDAQDPSPGPGAPQLPRPRGTPLSSPWEPGPGCPQAARHGGCEQDRRLPRNPALGSRRAAPALPQPRRGSGSRIRSFVFVSWKDSDYRAPRACSRDRAHTPRVWKEISSPEAFHSPAEFGVGEGSVWQHGRGGRPGEGQPGRPRLHL